MAFSCCSFSGSKICCCWYNLPSELLEEILKRLNNPLDIYRCQKVCSSWQSAANHINRYPLLLILDDLFGTGTLCNIFNGDTERIDLPNLEEEDHWIYTSNNGWLLIINSSPPFEAHLYNPISRKQIFLPSATKFLLLSKINIYRCIITSTGNPSDCNVVVVYGFDPCKKLLAFCKPGDEIWKSIDEENEVCFVDIIIYKNHIYATDFQGKIYGCEICSSSKIVLLLQPPYFGLQRNRNLIESVFGDLLMISKQRHYVEEGDGEEFIAHTFEVYKIDLGAKKWTKIESIKEEAIFLGPNARISIPVSAAANCGSMPRGNCIYFTHNSDDLLFDGETNASIFDLETGRIQRLWTCHHSKSQFHWIVPSFD